MANKKKFITCDGNYAAAHIAYMFSEVAAFIPLLLHQTWQNMLMNGLLLEEKIFLVKQ